MSTKDETRLTEAASTTALHDRKPAADPSEQVPTPRTTGPANWPSPLRDVVSSRLSAYRRRDGAA
jgi:hypothetical protein